MNLRTRKSALRRDRKQKKEFNVITTISVYVIILALLSFGVFCITAYFDGQSQKINKKISSHDSKIYNFQREIQNLKILLAAKSRKEFIVTKIEKYGLGLQTPTSFQVINLRPMENDISIKGQEYAYNFR
ncbi:MAG TPA: hypothetical protein QF753_12010 [Victivallales bacterium]|nr:hypothetical protein [Victivallales bacterium]